MTLITGNTYPVKEAIKALGGRWNGAAKGWEVPDDVAEQAKALVPAGDAGGYAQRGGRSSYPRRSSRYGSSYTRFSSGAEVYTNRAGRCEDAPCCGCCS